MLTFSAVDVETANADRASICQIGVVHVRNGEIHDEWQTVLDPEDWFDDWNVMIHVTLLVVAWSERRTRQSSTATRKARSTGRQNH